MNHDATQPIISPPLSPPPAMSSTLDAPQGEQPPEVGARQPSAKTQAKVKLPKGPYRPPPGLDNTKYLKSDLKAFGFDAKEVKQLVAKKEPVVDAQGQRPPHAAGIVVRSESHGSNNSWNDGEDGEDKWTGRAVRTTGKNGNGKGYEHLYLKEGTNWVLFDPLRGWPHFGPFGPPPFLLKWEYYEPGNAKLLEFNVISHSVRMRSCPDVLKGKQVVYTKTGPKIEKITGNSGRRGDTPMDGEDDVSPSDKQEESTQVYGATVSKEEVVKAEEAKVFNGKGKRKGKAPVEEEVFTAREAQPDAPKQETRKRARLSLDGTSQAKEEKQEAPKRSTRIRRAPLRLKQEIAGSDDDAIKAEEA
ncbi:hypothetical protein KC343_g2967 [Hortaea werneckii]|uniref:Uncharacterized protein n=1 Tax=Hortaea werneckii TaxID=91943 RepID=A0A3M7HC39_HORWE|nr:hypothetical protein KC352_g8953 [Hortaea werneckii]KAI7569314.1 hypothetical protein KC317_g3445 [Hortaea werneckii]KAI7620564.1 hypothetical protein KC346_g4039 [Hortaea werneckii]KAI7633413.1 hypothetical protein KC343_g2967 [Hortaea werneckii]KAI7678984.1 hypothetical protein KC319_g3008 [Hortaea werneckii]